MLTTWASVLFLAPRPYPYLDFRPIRCGSFVSCRLPPSLDGLFRLVFSAAALLLHTTCRTPASVALGQGLVFFCACCVGFGFRPIQEFSKAFASALCLMAGLFHWTPLPTGFVRFVIGFVANLLRLTRISVALGCGQETILPILLRSLWPHFFPLRQTRRSVALGCGQGYVNRMCLAGSFRVGLGPPGLTRCCSGLYLCWGPLLFHLPGVSLACFS